jgi:antitoxin VapB
MSKPNLPASRARGCCLEELTETLEDRYVEDRRDRDRELFMHVRSQAVRLPKEFRFEGREVRVTKVGDLVILQPIAPDGPMPWTTIDQVGDSPFMPEGREQPEAPADRATLES